MAAYERRIEDFRLAPPGWSNDSDEDFDFPFERELQGELDFAFFCSSMPFPLVKCVLMHHSVSSLIHSGTLANLAFSTSSSIVGFTK